jgi:hypothetical protein
MTWQRIHATMADVWSRQWEHEREQARKEARATVDALPIFATLQEARPYWDELTVQRFIDDWNGKSFIDRVEVEPLVAEYMSSPGAIQAILREMDALGPSALDAARDWTMSAVIGGIVEQQCGRTERVAYFAAVRIVKNYDLAEPSTMAQTLPPIPSRKPLWGVIWLRWVGILPVAFLFGCLAFVLGRLLNQFGLAMMGAGTTASNEVWVQVLAYWYMGAVSAYTAIWVAPSAKKVVAGVIAVAWVAFEFGSHDRIPVLYSGAICVAAAIVAIGAYTGRLTGNLAEDFGKRPHTI